MAAAAGDDRAFWYLDPYAAPSHEAVREQYLAHSELSWQRVVQPGFGWRWRLRSGGAQLAVALRDRLPAGATVLTTSMLDVAQFKGVLGRPVRVVQYMHENQLTYRRDVPGADELALRHAHSWLAADAVVFNSAFHRDAMTAALQDAYRAWPEGFVPPWTALAAVPVHVVHPPVAAPPTVAAKPEPPLILWNHRWCPEKNPEAFFAALNALGDARPYRLAVVGVANESPPAVFDAVRERWAGRAIAWGTQPRERYEALLAEAAIVVSTAREENFGIAVAEAMAHGALPVLPRRLSYPEIAPAWLHDQALYDGPRELVARLAASLDLPAARRAELGARLAAEVRGRFAPPAAAAALDAIVAGIGAVRPV